MSRREIKADFTALSEDVKDAVWIQNFFDLQDLSKRFSIGIEENILGWKHLLENEIVIECSNLIDDKYKVIMDHFW